MARFLDEIQVIDGWERFARRLLDTEKVRLFVTGSSMEPRYFAGDVIFVHPHKPVRQGDHVVIQEALHGGTVVSVKRFERFTDGHIVTTQYNPLAEVRFRRETVDAMHRVLTPNEIAGV